LIGRVGSTKRQRPESSPTLETRFDRDTTPIHADCIQKPNTMRTTSKIDYLATFRTRRDRCRELLDLSNEQDSLIERDDYTGLLDVLGRKQRILSEFAEAKQNQPELLSHWKTERDALAPELRDECEHLLAESESLLGMIIQEEKSSTEQLTSRRDETQGRLQTITQGSQVHDAYRDSLAPSTHRRLNVDG
jgi:hypothetical protein